MYMSDLVIEQITLEKANLIIKSAIDKAREIKINPIMVVLLDHRGAIKACSGEDGISSLRFQIAHGKANGAFQMGIGSRALFNRAEQQAYFINAVNTLTDGALVAVPGGVLILLLVSLFSLGNVGYELHRQVLFFLLVLL